MANFLFGAITVVGLTATLIALMFGSSMVEQSYPDFRSVSFSACDDFPNSPIPFFGRISDGTKVMGCWVANLGAIILNVFFFAIGTCVFLFNVMTFNVPGSPSWARALISVLLGGPVLFIIMTAVFRGSGDGG